MVGPVTYKHPFVLKLLTGGQLALSRFCMGGLQATKPFFLQINAFFMLENKNIHWQRKKIAEMITHPSILLQFLCSGDCNLPLLMNNSIRTSHFPHPYQCIKQPYKLHLAGDFNWCIFILMVNEVWPLRSDTFTRQNRPRSL